MSRTAVIKDTTFRDGIQGMGVEALDLAECLKAIARIDSLGVSYHELGFAIGNEASAQRIKAALQLDLQGKVCAFGRTLVSDVDGIIELDVPVGVLVGKSRASDAENALRLSKDRNLDLIRKSVATLVAAGVEVIFDAEHFFQAFHEDERQYSLQVIATAYEAGARYVVLCDTNGAMTPARIHEAVNTALQDVPTESLGIHTHNDRGRAIANAEAGFLAGATLVEGTIGGVGERTGNMDLCTFMPNAAFDWGAQVNTPEQMKRLTSTYNLVSDVLNRSIRREAPWVGTAAFYTEAGMHKSGEDRVADNYTHADPRLVGNHKRVGLTDQSGKANLVAKAAELGITIPEDQLSRINAEFQVMIDAGSTFVFAEASFHLFLLRQLDEMTEFFKLDRWRMISEKIGDERVTAEASIALVIEGERKLEVADIGGPIDVLDNALRRVLKKSFPELMNLNLVTYKVNIVNSEGTSSKVRVLIEMTDGEKTWGTMAVHENILEASWEALVDAYLYKLVVNGK